MDSAPPSMRPVSGAPDFVALEEGVLGFWKESRAPEKQREMVKGRPPFRSVDGPITANNPMGVHHAWGRTLKDAFIRYHVMNGRSSRFQNGFDCQGLWVEVEVEKEKGFQSKRDIEEFGLDNFSNACRARVDEFSKVISEQSARLGQWMDWEDSYYTHTQQNILGIWHFLKKCHENGWIYEGALPMPWCPRCGTSLSEHEMAGSHKELTHTAIFAHVPLSDGTNRRLLVWTTTPWTLSANVAAAVNPKLEYAEVTSPEWEGTLVLAKSAIGVLGDIQKQVGRCFKGAELVGLGYETFFPDFEAQQAVEHRVVAWEDVDGKEGSGIVHIAPGCGREDYELGLKEGLAQVTPVDGLGDFLPTFGWLAGKKAAEVPEEVAEALKGAGKLFRAEPHTHSYPVCWRCKGELLFLLVKEWFIRCDEVRPRMIAAAKTVTWRPEYLGKRMEDWLHNMGDWCISRKRFWGLPLPFYRCTAEDCAHFEVIGSLEELREKAVDPAQVDSLEDIHRPWIDEVHVRCAACAAPMERTPEVGDCWLDAGIVPFSTLSYFEDRKEWERQFPAEFVCEMREQIRLWFYSMLFMSVTIEDRAPYEQVLGYERVVAEDGSMFSKTGFMIRFDEAVAKLGADPMRYMYCAQSATSELRFGYGNGEIAQRKLAAIWNVYSFFVTYALIDHPVDVTLPDRERLTVTDRWVLARTAKLVEVAKRGYDAYDTAVVVREVERFVEDLSNWYVRVSRRRFWRGADEQADAGCFPVLHTALKSLIQVLAPVVPFFTEELWQNLVRPLEADAPESIHHSTWPAGLDAWADDALLERTETARELIRCALRAREMASLRVRQPLAGLHVHGTPEVVEALGELAAEVQSELNVKELVVADDPGSFRRYGLALDFKKAGPVLKGDIGKVKGLVAALSPEQSEVLAAVARAGQDVTVPGHDAPIPAQAFALEASARAGFAEEEGPGFVLAIDTRISPELLREGLVRDLVRNVQIVRKEADLDVSQRIRLALVTDDPELGSAIEEHSGYVQAEVLAEELVRTPLAGSVVSKELEIQGRPVEIGVAV